MSDAATFERVILKWHEDEVVGEYMKRLRTIALQLLRMLIQGSPVDTGRFRGNWDVAIEALVTTNPAPDSGYAGDSRPARGARATTDALSRGLSSLAVLKVADRIPAYITLGNNLPYGRRLEYEGWSKQVGAGGWLRASVAAMQERINAGAI